MKGEGLATVKAREQTRSMIESKRIEGLMQTSFETADPDTPISDVVARMRALDLHEIPIIEDNNKLMGVVSYGSLLKRKNLSVGAKARTVMETPPQITTDSPLTEVAEKIVSTGYRQIPVVRGRKVLGVMSRKEVMCIVPEVKDLRTMKVCDIMTRDVQTVTAKDPVKRAVEIMGKLDVRTLPVVDGSNRLVAIVGFKDVVNYNWVGQRRETVGEVTGRSDPIEVEVGSLAVDNPITIEPCTPIGEAVSIMLEKDISTLPVVENGELQGIVTTYDVVELVASFRQRDIVYVQITGLDEEDRYSLDIMDREIQTELQKVAKISRPLLFTLHVTKYNPEGNAAKYSLNGRLITEDRIFVAKAVEWNLIKATIAVMERLQGRVKEMKESRLDRRKKASREGPATL